MICQQPRLFRGRTRYLFFIEFVEMGNRISYLKDNSTTRDDKNVRLSLSSIKFSIFHLVAD